MSQERRPLKPMWIVATARETGQQQAICVSACRRVLGDGFEDEPCRSGPDVGGWNADNNELWLMQIPRNVCPYDSLQEPVATAS